MTEPRILVAGIGNVFLGDDGFGVEVVRRLAERPPEPGVRVGDFGIRGFDLACAMLEPWDLVVLVDVVRRGGSPGTLYLIEVPEGEGVAAGFEAHGMAPSQVFRAVRALGGGIRNVFLVGCEPEDFGDPVAGRMGLGGVLATAVEGAIGMIDALLRRKREELRVHA